MTQDHPFELADAGPGRETDLGEAAGELAVRDERLGVPARGVARGHELGHQLLAQRILGDERAQLGGCLIGAAEGVQRGGARAAEPIAERVKSPRLDRRDVVGQLEIGERLAAPERQRLVADGQRIRRRPAVGCLGELDESVRVDRSRSRP